jgi:hypothetical protein
VYNDPSHRHLLSAAPDAPFISSTNGDLEIDSDGHTFRSTRHQASSDAVRVAGHRSSPNGRKLLGDDSVAIAFLRYLPERLSPFGVRVETALRERLAEAPSFVAFEGYDTVVVLAELLRLHGPRRARVAEAWLSVTLEGTRGQIQYSRTPGISVWQWAWPPIQVVDRDPARPDRFRVLHAA